MALKLYINSSDERYLDKSITLKHTLSNFKFKDDTSIINPQLEVAYHTDLLKCNYAYIDETDRYYYIRNIVVSDQRVYLTLEVDVLMTYRAAIRGCTGVMARQEKRWSGYLADSEGLENQYKRTTLKAFSSPFTKSLHTVLAVGG